MRIGWERTKWSSMIRRATVRAIVRGKAQRAWTWLDLEFAKRVALIDEKEVAASDLTCLVINHLSAAQGGPRFNFPD